RYLSQPSEGMPLHAGMLAVLAVLMLAARRRIRDWAGTPEAASPVMNVFERPLASTVVIALLLVPSPSAPLPPAARSLVMILGLGAAVRIVRLTADPRLTPELYALWVLFAVDGYREATAHASVIEQTFLAIEMLAGIAVLTYSLTAGGLRRLSEEAMGAGRLATYRRVGRLIVLILAVALVAGAFGYLRLARLLASGVLGSSALALMLY